MGHFPCMRRTEAQFCGCLWEGGEKVRVTDVRLKKIASEGRMRAVASVTFDDQFVVHDIRVIEGQNGLFVAMPSRRTPEGEYRDIAHPITAEAREAIQNAILRAYNEEKETE